MHTITTLATAFAVICVLALAQPARADDGEPKPGPAQVNLTQMTLNQHDALDPGAGVRAVPSGTVHVDGSPYALHDKAHTRAGLYVSDGRGGYIWLGSQSPVAAPSPRVAGARELKLKIREMASQLLESGATLPGGAVAMPVSFVNQDEFNQTSSFGRYIAEQMFYEFNQQGVPVREYRMYDSLRTRPLDGEFLLSRDMEEAKPVDMNALILVGTYYTDKENVFVNARLIRPADGLVIRTALLVFAQTPVTKTMLAKGTALRLATTDVELKSYDEVKDETSIGFILQEGDLH